MLPSEDTAIALELRQRAINKPQPELLVPTIFWYEVANVLWAAVKRKRLSRNEAASALETLVEFELLVKPVDPATCLNFSFDHSLSVYDTTYLVLAIEQSAQLWTFDQQLGITATGLGLQVFPGGKQSSKDQIRS